MIHEVLEPMKEIDQEKALRENDVVLKFFRVDVLQRLEWLFIVLL